MTAPNEQSAHCRVTVEEALARLPGAAADRFATVFRHGTLEVEIYAPRGADPQTPHTRDEVYIVVQGSGTFVCDQQQQPCGPGDFLFVPAGVEHRFLDFTEELTVWVLFYGPEGGETPEGGEKAGS